MRFIFISDSIYDEDRRPKTEDRRQHPPGVGQAPARPSRLRPLASGANRVQISERQAFRIYFLWISKYLNQATVFRCHRLSSKEAVRSWQNQCGIHVPLARSLYQ
jgi:hypothetical protein